MSSLSGFQPNSGSFRDPHSRVFEQGNRVIRALSHEAYQEWRQLEQKRFFKQFLSQGRIIETSQLTESGLIAEGWSHYLEHHRIPCISYPYEWCFEMLKDAAVLQLELLRQALEEGMIFKDATPYNVQFLGAKPVFIDITSCVRHNPSEPWQAYGQFCQLFLFPLMLKAYRGVSFQPLLRAYLDGIPPHNQWAFMSLRDLLRRGVFSHVYLHAALQFRSDKPAQVRSRMRESGFGVELIKHNVGALLKLVRSLTHKPSRSAWSSYEQNCPYEVQARKAKEDIVQAVVSQKRRRIVWDIGCNTGFFSRLAAANSDYVLALDSDAECVEQLYARLREEGHSTILPLVWDAANPSPGIGFKNEERKPLHERARPEMILALALIHHLAITANIPLTELLPWFASLAPEILIEWVGPADSMAKELLSRKNIPYTYYSLATFESVCQRYFRIAARWKLPGEDREVLHLERL